MTFMTPGYVSYLVYNMVQPEPNGVASDNGIRFSTEAALGNPTDTALIATLRRGIATCQIEPGLLARYPGNKLQEGPDDYYAAACFGYHFYPTLAERIYAYGQKHFFIFNNTGGLNRSAFFAWLQPALIAHMRHCAGKRLFPWHQFFICLGLFLTTLSDDQDGWILSWFMVRAMKGKYFFIDKMIVYWQKKLKSYAARGIGEILSRYYAPMHEQHPNAQALLDVFE